MEFFESCEEDGGLETEKSFDEDKCDFCRVKAVKAGMLSKRRIKVDILDIFNSSILNLKGINLIANKNLISIFVFQMHSMKKSFGRKLDWIL